MTLRELKRIDEQTQQRIEEVCAGVFGGNDYLPRLATSLAEDEHTHLFSVEDGQGIMVGLAVVTVVGDGSAFFYGHRTAEGFRGQGFGMLGFTMAVEHAFRNHPAVTCCRLTHNSRASASRYGSFRHLQTYPLIRVQQGDGLEWLREQLLHVQEVELERISAQDMVPLWDSLSVDAKKRLCPVQGTIILAAWKAVMLHALTQADPSSIQYVLVERDATNHLVGFSIGGVGANSSFGTVHSIFVSPGASFEQHVRAQLDLRVERVLDAEVYTFEAVQVAKAELFSRNIDYYRGVGVVLLEQTREQFEAQQNAIL